MSEKTYLLVPVGLGKRALNVVARYNTLEELKAALENGELKRARNVGADTRNTIREWLDLPLETREHARKCPEYKELIEKYDGNFREGTPPKVE